MLKPSWLALPARKAKLILCTLALILPASLWAQGNFLPGVNYPVTGKGKIGVGDVNEDGKPDVIVANQDNTVGILLGNGDGTLQAQTLVSVLPSSSASFTADVAVGDFNGDGFLDIAVLCATPNNPPSTFTGSIQILLGNGNGTFQAPVEVSIDGLNPASILAADFNNDKKLDLVVLNLASSSVTILLGNGNGTFATGVDYAMPSGTTPQSMAIGDLNGDGRPDIAVAGETTTNVGTITVFLTDPDGSLGTGTNWITTSTGVCPSGDCGGPTAVAIADMNNDGKLDLVGDYGVQDGVVCLPGNGDGTFGTPVYSGSLPLNGGVPNASSHLVIDDFNGDGKLDLAEAVQSTIFSVNYDLLIYPGNGDGSFQSPVFLGEGTVGVASVATSMVSAELDGDRLPNLVLATNSGRDTSQGFNAVTVVLNCGSRCSNTSLMSSAPTSMFNQSVAFTASVMPLNAKATSTPTGSVLFQDTSVNPATNLGTATLASGSAAFTFSGLSVGSHSITASYQGDQNFVASVSSPVTQTVGMASTSTSISSSPNPSNSGQSVTFTAMVIPATSGVPTGNVIFSDNGTQTVSVPLDGAGSATFSISSLTTGTHTIMWAYSGDANFTTSTSAPLTQIIGSSSSPMAISPSRTSATVGAGQSASFMLAITPLTGFSSSSSISFSCSGLPALASCSFSPSTLTTKGSVVTTLLTITTTGSHSGSAALRPFGTNVVAASSLFVAGLAVFPFAGKRRKLASLMGLTCLLSMTMLLLVACGGGSSTTTPPPTQPTTTPAGTYTVAVTAAASNGSQTQNLSLTVTP